MPELFRVYLDVSCLNRPFDDQGQARIRLEAEAIRLVFELADRGQLRSVSSEMAEIEIDAMSDALRWQRVGELLPDPIDIIELTPAVFVRAEQVEGLGLAAADAVHVAAAEAAGADVLLTCDEKLRRQCIRRRKLLKVEVANPVDWIREHFDEANNG